MAGPGVLGVPVDPDRDEARRLLTEELDSSEYALKESWLQRFLDWLSDLLPRPQLPGSLPGWTTWAILAAVLAAALAVVVFASRDRWRRASLAQRSASPVLDGTELTAAEHRAAARAALAAGRADEALVEAVRAIAVGAGERTLLEPRPGRTAHELAVELGAVLPEHSGALRAASVDFDAVRYGEERVSGDRARAVLQLEEQVAAARPRLASAEVLSSVPSVPR